MSTTAVANRVAVRYGDLASLAELESFFGKSLRALRPMLEKRGVPVIKIGSAEFVQVAVLEERLGLVPVDALREEQEMTARRAQKSKGLTGRQLVAQAHARTGARLGARLVDR